MTSDKKRNETKNKLKEIKKRKINTNVRKKQKRNKYTAIK